MTSIEEIRKSSLRLDQLKLELQERQKLIQSMVGNLYPAIVANEMEEIKQMIMNYVPRVIDEFNDRTGYAFLSNFYYSDIIYNDKVWRSVEHLFQASKTTDTLQQEEIRNAPTPGKAKKLGKKVRLRPDWEERKFAVMVTCVNYKFTQNDYLRKRLMETGDALLVEGNHWHDNIWGNCDCENCQGIQGTNLLGKALMEVREAIRGLEG